MAAIARIEHFNSAVLQLPLNLKAIQSAKESFKQLLSYDSDPACRAALDKAKVLLSLKEEQAILASRVQSALASWNQLVKSVGQASSANYKELSSGIKELRNDLDALRDDAFPPTISKQTILSKLEIFDRYVETKNPDAWKKEALACAAIAVGVGLFFTATSIADSPDMGAAISHFGVGLGVGAAGVAISKTLSKVREVATPLLSKSYKWAMSAAPIQKSIDLPRIKVKEQTASPMKVNTPLNPLHPAKKLGYDKLTGGTAPDDPILFSTANLADPASVLKCKVFQCPKQLVVEKEGRFAFPPSTNEIAHWTADFASSKLLGSIEGEAIAQEELLAIEHPVLYHLKALLDKAPSFHPLKQNSVALIAHICRYGAFSGSSLDEIEEKLKPLENPTFSNLFAVALPQNWGQAGEPCHRQHLKELFLLSCTAFSAVAAKSESVEMRAIAHTGNWGDSPLAAALCQILAARAAGIELHYYPANEKAALARAQEILTRIEDQKPDACIGEILVHLAAHAEEYGIAHGS